MNCHCQICEREIKAKNGIIAHHGYTRPYPQEQTRSCDGARELPYEVSRDAIPAAIQNVKAFRDYQKSLLVSYMKEGPETLTYFPGVSYLPTETLERPEGFDPKYSAENWEYQPHKRYEREFYKAIKQIKSNLVAAGQELGRLQKRYDNWVKVR
jgi:hypothetical protein